MARRATEVVVGVVAVLASLSLLGSCAGKRPSLGAITPSTSRPGSSSSGTSGSTSTTLPGTSSFGSRDLGPSDLLGWIATPKGSGDIAVYTNPGRGAGTQTFHHLTHWKSVTTFAVIGDAGPDTVSPTPGWYQVLLPSKPNDTLGWVRQADVTLSHTNLQIDVSLADRTLKVLDGLSTVMSVPVAIGTSTNPTPGGGTYVTDLVQNTNPAGAYGPYAFALALHSETLDDFAGGDGQVAIHGTDEPSKIGQAVSHGCVRLTNANITKLEQLSIPLGTPVLIR